MKNLLSLPVHSEAVFKLKSLCIYHSPKRKILTSAPSPIPCPDGLSTTYYSFLMATVTNIDTYFSVVNALFEFPQNTYLDVKKLPCDFKAQMT